MALTRATALAENDVRRATYKAQPAWNPANGPNALSAYRTGPPVPSKWLASSANTSITGSVNAAQITNTHGLKLPARRAASPGNPKMPAPMMPLITSSHTASPDMCRAIGSERRGAAGVMDGTMTQKRPGRV